MSRFPSICGKTRYSIGAAEKHVAGTKALIDLAPVTSGLKSRPIERPCLPRESEEQGYILLAALVAIALILIAMSVAATKVAFSLRREREEESVRRANQYVRAIREYYLKFHTYPGSIEQLEKTNNIRFLRQRYVDPLTGKPDYRLIHVGQNKTQVAGFFGEPLTGLPTSGLGAAAGMQSPGIGGTATPGTGFGGIGGSAATPTPGTPGATGAAGAAGASGTTAAAGMAAASATGGTDTGTTGANGGIGSQSATSFGGSGGGPIMGVGSSATGSSTIEVNGQNTYETWEFLYDPRLELLKQKGQMNQGIGSTNAGSLGQTPGSLGAPASTNGQPATGTNNTGNPGSSPTGPSPSTQPNQ